MVPKLDTAIVQFLADARAAQPPLTTLGLWVTSAGSAYATVALTLLGVAWLALAGRWRRMAVLLAVVLGGRLAIDGLKLLVERPRPSFGTHPVAVNSWSFPSGHAGNSMIAFVALALLVAPPRWRRPAIVAAIAASLAIGVTRPLLGVHWPSDVVAGWLFGLAWVTGWLALARSRGWLSAE